MIDIYYDYLCLFSSIFCIIVAYSAICLLDGIPSNYRRLKLKGFREGSGGDGDLAGESAGEKWWGKK